MQRKTRKSPAKKAAPRKRKAKKAKVALDSKKLMLLCAAVCASCVLLLAVTAFLSRKAEAPKIQEKPRVESESLAKSEIPEKEKLEKKDSPKTKAEEKAKNKNPGDEKAKPKKEEKAKTAEEKSSAVTPKTEKKTDEKTSAVAPKTEKEKEPSPVSEGFAFPFAKNNAVLCVVFDDGGQNVGQLKKCVALPFPVTVAVLPRLAHSAECASLVRQSGNEVILHQPMQAVNLNVNPGEGAIKPQMSQAEVAATLSQNIAEIAPIAGMNNHEGSLITEDEALVSFVLETVQEKGIYFLDSRTSSATKVHSVAMEMGMGYYKRDIFLDNKKTRENYLSELKKGLDIANKKGHVIMIGHVWSAESLPAFLEEAYPELALKGYRFATVSKSGGMIK